MGDGQYQVTGDGAKVDDVRTYIFMEVVNCGTDQKQLYIQAVMSSK